MSRVRNPADLQDGPATAALTELWASIETPLYKVEKLLTESIQSPVERITEIAEHLLSAGGKRLRPALTILCAQMAGADTKRTVTFATVVELMHTATLIHDDVIDDAGTRRGRPSANRLWGNQSVVMAGDYLYAKSFEILAEDGDVEIIRLFSDASSKMCAGEILELQKAFDSDLSEAGYEEIIRLKTGQLIRAACEAGVISGGGEWVTAGRLGQFGLHIGMAFQMVDDLLDICGDGVQLGKPAGNDLIEGKVTLPIIRTLSTLPDAERDVLARIISSREVTSDNATVAASIVHGGDGIEYARRAARQFVERGLSCVEKLLPHRTLENLRIITEFVMERQF